MSEPTPGRARVETWRRGDEQAFLPVDERGIVQCSAELMHQLLEQAGWERAT